VSAGAGSLGTSLACLVVDANVVIKWHVTEVHTDAALRLLRDDAPAMHVPDLVFPEVGNILWKKVRRGDLTEEQAREIGRLVAVAPLEVHCSAPLLEAALDIAMLTGRTVYDSIYVALAVQMDCRLVTADEKVYNALKDGPLGARILWVEDDLGISVIGEAGATQRGLWPQPNGKTRRSILPSLTILHGVNDSRS
jgi:predicted nucleic acid-binding protein